MKRWFAKIVILLLRGYQFFISPLLGQRCRFHPSCSQYAIDAVHIHGVFNGVWLTILRLVRCHPFHPGGIDLVPPGKHKGDNTPC